MKRKDNEEEGQCPRHIPLPDGLNPEEVMVGSLVRLRSWA